MRARAGMLDTQIRVWMQKIRMVMGQEVHHLARRIRQEVNAATNCQLSAHLWGGFGTDARVHAHTCSRNLREHSSQQYRLSPSSNSTWFRV